MKLSKGSASEKQPLTTRCVVPLNADDAKAIEDAQASVSRAQLLGDAEGLSSARKRLSEVLDEVGPRGLEVTFRSIGRKEFNALKSQYPPTPDQVKEAESKRQVATWDPDKFGPALCARAAVDCDMDEDDWRTQIWESPKWGESEVAVIFNAAVGAQSDSQVVQLGN